MGSREKILAAVQERQPSLRVMPDVSTLSPITFVNAVDQFCTVVQNIGGVIVRIRSEADIAPYVSAQFPGGRKLVTTIPGIDGVMLMQHVGDAHQLEDIELAIVSAVFGVAENGAVWMPDTQVPDRVLPFICQHLAAVVRAGEIVHNMHEAYERIGNAGYGFGVFIAGPSKTADIEQSLVLGAHGPRSMTIFLLE